MAIEIFGLIKAPGELYLRLMKSDMVQGLHELCMPHFAGAKTRIREHVRRPS